MKPEDAFTAILGSTHVYVCVGLKYNKAIWKRDWPVLIQHVIDACKKMVLPLFFLTIYTCMALLPWLFLLTKIMFSNLPAKRARSGKKSRI